MKTNDNPDWKAVANGGTVKIATQESFRKYDSVKRGWVEQVNKACDTYFERKGITYGNSWFARRKEEGKGMQAK